jgi:hypothetical protein
MPEKQLDYNITSDMSSVILIGVKISWMLQIHLACALITLLALPVSLVVGVARPNLGRAAIGLLSILGLIQLASGLGILMAQPGTDPAALCFKSLVYFAAVGAAELRILSGIPKRQLLK